MPPSFTIDDQIYVLKRDAKTERYGPMRHGSCNLANRVHIIGGQLRQAMLFAAVVGPVTYLVGHVLGVGRPPKMRPSNASMLAAPTTMSRLVAVRRIASRHSAYDVGRASPAAVKIDNAISLIVAGKWPDQTFFPDMGSRNIEEG